MGGGRERFFSGHESFVNGVFLDAFSGRDAPVAAAERVVSTISMGGPASGRRNPYDRYERSSQRRRFMSAPYGFIGLAGDPAGQFVRAVCEPPERVLRFDDP